MFVIVYYGGVVIVARDGGIDRHFEASTGLIHGLVHIYHNTGTAAVSWKIDGGDDIQLLIEAFQRGEVGDYASV